jgi:hypothetical protein
VEAVDLLQRWRDDQDRKALSADTGFCSPTETVYDLCDVGTVDGLISLQQVRVCPRFACRATYLRRSSHVIAEPGMSSPPLAPGPTDPAPTSRHDHKAQARCTVGRA